MVVHPVRYTYREYLALDATSNVKLEYLAGQIHAMAGRSPDHAALQVAVPSLLYELYEATRQCRGAGWRPSVRRHRTS